MFVVPLDAWGFTPGDPRLKYDTPKVLYHLIGQGIQCICGILTYPTYDGNDEWRCLDPRGISGQQSCMDVYGGIYG